MNRFRLFACCLLSGVTAWAQPIPKPISVDSDIVWAGVDRPGDLFVVLASGEVQKYDKTGKKIGSHRFKAPPTLLDPLDGVQSFFYQRAGNQYGTLSYDFSTVNEKPLDPSFAISPWLVCPALHELWILDSADFTIKKTTMHAMTISLESALKHLPDKKISDYLSIREYQNYVFLLDQSAGVHIFNPLGKYVRTLGEKGMTYFNFLGEDMYYISGQDIVFVNLYTTEQRRHTLESTTPYHFALINEDTLYGIGRNTISVSRFKP